MNGSFGGKNARTLYKWRNTDDHRLEQPAGDFDPTEKQGELLMLLSGQQVTVHTSAEDDFDYMENEDVAFVVKNQHSEEESAH